jgi:hypothetical protein
LDKKKTQKAKGGNHNEKVDSRCSSPIKRLKLRQGKAVKMLEVMSKNFRNFTEKNLSGTHSLNN